MKKKVYLSDVLECLGSSVLNIYGKIEDVYIDNLSDSEHTSKTTLDWVKPSNSKRQTIVEHSPAKVIIVGENVDYSETIKEQDKILIVVKSPRNAIAKVGSRFFVDKPQLGIHPTAIVSEEAEVGENVSIGAYCVIGKVKIGNGTVIGTNVRIYDDCEIGNNCTIADYVILGSEGFGFEKDERGNWMKFPQIGALVIGDNVEIGSFTVIDRGALSTTSIGDYSKIDSLCKIAHNVVIGKNVIITGCCSIAGSNVIEDNVWISPNSTLKDWGHIGKDSFVGMGSVVVTKLKPNSRVFGNPAKKVTLG